MRQLAFLFLLLGARSHSQQPVADAQLQQQAEARQEVIGRQQAPRGFVPVARAAGEVGPPINANGGRCFPVQVIQLDGDSAEFFAGYLEKSLQKQEIKSRRHGARFETQDACLNATAIENLNRDTQNALIDGGWVSSRLLVPDQDLSKGQLHFQLLPGRVGKLQLQDETGRAPHLATILPLRAGALLSLRDLEQGLENLRRLPSVNAQIDLVPGAAPGISDLRINWQQERWWRLNLALDDSGSQATGRYQGTIGLNVDNPLRLSDSLAINYSHNLLPGSKQTSLSGHSGRGRSDNQSLNYSLPLGYWTVELASSRYYYDQAVAGQTRTYHYQGRSRQHSLNLNRTLYRDGQHKLEASVGLWQKVNNSYVDDREIGVQRRQTAGWNAGLRQISYFNSGHWQADLNFKKGTRWLGAKPAPEEALGEGTARMGIWTLDLSATKRFNPNFSGHSRWHGQWSREHLTPIDRLSLGGRYNVRGFNGDITLSGDRGWFWRNELRWHYRPEHQLYFALDGGRVSGPSSRNLPGHGLVGAALGLRGDLKGNSHYDLFLGTPISAPASMKADKFVVGFNFNYSY